jgi:hypothetical protein
MKMEKLRHVENYSSNGGKRGIERMMERVNSTMIHSKNFCKCHNIPPVQQ